MAVGCAFDGRLPIEFHDLEPFSTELMEIEFACNLESEGGGETALNQF